MHDLPSIQSHVLLTAGAFVVLLITIFMASSPKLIRFAFPPVVWATVFISTVLLVRSDVWSAAWGDNRGLAEKAVTGIALALLNLWLSAFFGKMAWDSRKNAPLDHHPDFPPPPKRREKSGEN